MKKLTVPDMFTDIASKYPDKEAIIYPEKDQRWTYQELKRKVDALAYVLAEFGVEKGDLVSAYLFNGSEIPTAMLAANEVGAGFNPLIYRLGKEDIVELMDKGEQKVLFFGKRRRDFIADIKEKLDKVQDFIYVDDDVPDFAKPFYGLIEDNLGKKPPEREVNEEDPHIIYHTSGTTGFPKLVAHSNRNGIYCSIIMSKCLNHTPESKGLSIGPLCHAAELGGGFRSRMAFGGTNIIHQEFEPERTLETIEKESITHLFAVPTMWKMLIDSDPENYDLSSLSVIYSAGGRITRELAEGVLDKFSPDKFYNWLGQSEANLYSIGEITKDNIEKAETVRSFPTVELRVIEEGGSPEDVCETGERGEIIRRSPADFDYYIGEPDRTERVKDKNGWVHTEDQGYFDEDGDLWYAGRGEDFIVSGGENVSAIKVEDAVSDCEDVDKVSVLGLPDEKWGEVVTAVVNPKSESLTEEELKEFCKKSDKLADFEVPRKIIFVDEFPTTAKGTIQKLILKEWIS